MKTCPKCNQTMPDDLAFCSVCGTSLSDGESEFGDGISGMGMGLQSKGNDSVSFPPLASADQEEDEQPVSAPANRYESGAPAPKKSPFRVSREVEDAVRREVEAAAAQRTRPEGRDDGSHYGDHEEAGRRMVPSSPRAVAGPSAGRPNPFSQPNPNRRSAFGDKRPSANRQERVEEDSSEEKFVPIPPFAAPEETMESPFSPMSKSARQAMEKAAEQEPAPKPKSSGSANDLFNTDKTGFESTKPCPRCGSMTYPNDTKCLFCGYNLVKIRRINVGAVVAAMALAVAVFLPFISTILADGSKSTIALFGATDGYLFLALAAVVFIIALTGRNVFIIALGVIAAIFAFYENSIRIYQIGEDKWGDLIFKKEWGYYVFYAAAAAIIVTGVVGAINSHSRNKQKMEYDFIK